MYVFLASPYTHPDEAIMQRRYDEMCEVVRICRQYTVPCFSPIVHWHPVSLEEGPNRALDIEAYAIQSFGMIHDCYEFWIITQEGWEKSLGVEIERDYAKSRWHEVRYVALSEVHEACKLLRRVRNPQLYSSWEKLLERMKSAKAARLSARREKN